MYSSVFKSPRNPIRIQIGIHIQYDYMLRVLNHSELQKGVKRMYFAQNLKFLREKIGESLVGVARRFKVSYMTISRYENGECQPSLEMLINLADFYNISVDDLLKKDLRPALPLYISNIKYIRELYGITQEDMANYLGFSGKSSISLIESGKTEISVDNLIKLADYFGLTLDQLVKQDLSKRGNDT